MAGWGWEMMGVLCMFLDTWVDLHLLTDGAKQNGRMHGQTRQHTASQSETSECHDCRGRGGSRDPFSPLLYKVHSWTLFRGPTTFSVWGGVLEP